MFLSIGRNRQDKMVSEDIMQIVLPETFENLMIQYGFKVMPFQVRNIRSVSRIRVSFQIKPYSEVKSAYGTMYRKRTDAGRLVNGVCYHGYMALLTELFAEYPDALVVAGKLIRFNGARDYFSSTIIGSLMTKCGCDSDTDAKVWNRYNQAWLGG